MFKRIMVAVVCVPLLFAVLYALPEIGLVIAVSAISGIAIYEALYSTGFLRHPRITGYSILLAAAIPFWVYYDGRPMPALMGLFLYVLLLFCDAMCSGKQVGLERMGGAFFLSVMVPFFLSSFLRLRKLEDWPFYVLLPLVVAFLSDSFALFTGMACGKHKLAPRLSPKKTVEGAVGAVVGATLSAVIYGLLAKPIFGTQGIQLWALIPCGAVGSVVSQLGDLSFSYIKREYGIKDFGKLFPGHGGVLDRFDSVILCAPFVEILIYLVPVVK